MFEFIVNLFSDKTPNPKPREKWICGYQRNPWVTEDDRVVTIMDTKDGWVKFEWSDIKGPIVWKIGFFKDSFKRYD